MNCSQQAYDSIRNNEAIQTCLHSTDINYPLEEKEVLNNFCNDKYLITIFIKHD